MKHKQIKVLLLALKINILLLFWFGFCFWFLFVCLFVCFLGVFFCFLGFFWIQTRVVNASTAQQRKIFTWKENLKHLQISFQYWYGPFSVVTRLAQRNLPIEPCATLSYISMGTIVSYCSLNTRHLEGKECTFLVKNQKVIEFIRSYFYTCLHA